MCLPLALSREHSLFEFNGMWSPKASLASWPCQRHIIFSPSKYGRENKVFYLVFTHGRKRLSFIYPAFRVVGKSFIFSHIKNGSDNKKFLFALSHLVHRNKVRAER